jgi:ABC-type branched-subunit amino acid transport system ATPase component
LIANLARPRRLTEGVQVRANASDAGRVQVGTVDDRQVEPRAAIAGLATTSPRAAAGALLAVEGLSVAYGGGAISALEDVTLTVLPGEIVVLLGANGAGKTTALRAVTGLLGVHGGSITSGEVRFDREVITRSTTWASVKRGIALVMEGRRVFPELSVEDNLKAGGHITRDRAAFRANFARVLELFPRLTERRSVSAGLLSGGEQQMLAMGRALMQSPRLLLLDEPSLGLAPLVVEQIRQIIVEINKSGTGVVLIEQNATMALSIADHAYVLEHRRIARQGTGIELLADDSIRDLYLGLGAEGRRSYRVRPRAAVAGGPEVAS